MGKFSENFEKWAEKINNSKNSLELAEVMSKLMKEIEKYIKNREFDESDKEVEIMLNRLADEKQQTFKNIETKRAWEERKNENLQQFMKKERIPIFGSFLTRGKRKAGVIIYREGNRKARRIAEEILHEFKDYISRIESSARYRFFPTPKERRPILEINLIYNQVDSVVITNIISKIRDEGFNLIRSEPFINQNIYILQFEEQADIEKLMKKYKVDIIRPKTIRSETEEQEKGEERVEKGEPPKEPKPKRGPRISWHEKPSEFWKPIAALVGILFGSFLIATGNWIFGLPLLAAGLIILFTTEDLRGKLVNMLAYLKNHPKVSAPLGVILTSIVLFFILGFWAAIVPPIAAGLFYAVFKKRGSKGAEFFLEFIASVVGVILFVGGVHYASVYLFISFDWRQLVVFGIGNSILLWLLWFMGRGGKGELEELEKEKLEAEKEAAEAQKKAAEAAIAKKYTPSGGVYEANKMDREKQNDEKE